MALYWCPSSYVIAALAFVPGSALTLGAGAIFGRMSNRRLGPLEPERRDA